MTDKEKRVLSIQSTVVHGYAGGRSAVFPLQLHGFEVDAINTVLFSNHTGQDGSQSTTKVIGYGQWRGFKTTADQVMDLFEGLQISGIDNFHYLLTGYIPDAATATMVGKIAKILKEKDPELIWVLDPVLGDDGALYVAEELVTTYKSIIPQADIILPNQYEAEWLVDVKISKLDDILPCLEALHQRYRIRNVVISSIRLESHPDVILCCGSTSTSDFKPRPVIIEAPIIEGAFVGTGDLFAALLLARLHPFIRDLAPDDSVRGTDLVLARVLEEVIASMQGVLHKTRKAMDRQQLVDGDISDLSEKEKLVKTMRAAELRLVGSQDALLHPVVEFRAEPL